MDSLASKSYILISRRKVARIANEIKKKKVGMAMYQLSMLPQESARVLKKLIASASANFLSLNPNANVDDLQIKNIEVNIGPKMKRIRPRARGHADRIEKKTCHVKVCLSDDPLVKPDKKSQKKKLNKKIKNDKKSVK